MCPQLSRVSFTINNNVIGTAASINGTAASINGIDVDTSTMLEVTSSTFVPEYAPLYWTVTATAANSALRWRWSTTDTTVNDLHTDWVHDSTSTYLDLDHSLDLYTVQQLALRMQRPQVDVDARSRKVDWSNVPSEELTALRLLRGLVGQVEFRRYLSRGFVVAKGPSGLEYEIPRNRFDCIRVRERGEVVARLCVHLKQTARAMPPTDEVVAKLLLAEGDEHGLWHRSNVTEVKPEACVPWRRRAAA